MSRKGESRIVSELLVCTDGCVIFCPILREYTGRDTRFEENAMNSV